MKLIDANVLIYAVNPDDAHHEASRTWLDQALSGSETVGFAWIVLLTFIRLTTKVGFFPRPLPVGEAIDIVRAWLAQPAAVMVEPTPRHTDVLAGPLIDVGSTPPSSPSTSISTASRGFPANGRREFALTIARQRIDIAAADAASGDTVGVERSRSLSIEEVTVTYGAHVALDSVTMRVEAGTTMSLLGPSGSGKTSLLRAVAGLERPTTGSIRADDDVLSDPTHLVAPEHRRIGMVFQNHVLFPHLTVADNIGFGLSRESRRNGRVDEMLELVKLTGLGPRDPATLSGGQQQRVSLARALAPSPDLLLLDEPFASLDAILRIELRRDIHQLIRSIGVTTLFVTHDQNEAFALGDRVAVLREGTLIQTDTPEQLYDHPATPWLAGFVGEANLLPGALGADGHCVDTLLGAVELTATRAETNLAAGAQATVLIRPEQIRVALISPTTPPIGTPGRVSAADYRGATTLLTVTVDDDAIMVLRSNSDPAVRVGDTVELTLGHGPFPAWPCPDPCRSEG